MQDHGKNIAASVQHFARRVVLQKFLHVRGITHARNIATPIRVNVILRH